MGLAAVELLMEIEEAFDISIPDDRASRMRTVGDLYELILEMTADTTLESNTCLTAAAFYELRRHVRSLGCLDSEILRKRNWNESSRWLGDDRIGKP